MRGEGTSLDRTESLCPRCLKRIPAEKVMRGDKIYLVKSCPEHGSFEAILWRGQPDYLSWIRPKVPSQPKICFTQVEKGCPFDCGLCPGHRQHSCTVLLEVTQRCNLTCPLCFADARRSFHRHSEFCGGLWLLIAKRR